MSALRSTGRFLYEIYRPIFVRRAFYRLHLALFKLSLHGMGLQNLNDSDDRSGERDFLRNHLPTLGDAPIIFDVGANEGDYAQAANGISPKAHIYCFEPHPKTFSRLSANVEGKGIEVFNMGCGAVEGMLNLYDYEGDGSQHASVYRNVLEEIHHSNSVTLETKIVTLDGFCEERKIARIDFLKIDTEGHELAVLKGASRLLSERRIHTIHFEFNEMNVVSKVFFKDFVELLQDFDFFRMLPDGLIALGLYKAAVFELFAYQNVVCTRKASSL